MYGIRYFDMRVGYYAETEEKFWANHHFARVNPLPEIFAHVKRFLNETNEIIILDFHRFPVGFYNHQDRHHQLANYLLTEFEDYLVPEEYGVNITLAELWKSDKRLIVAYNHDVTASYGNYLWKGIPQKWGNKQVVSELNDFLHGTMAKHRDILYIWADMAELTPTAFDIILKPNLGLRKMADEVNRNLTIWAREDWWDKANIVATDFFLGNNIIDIALEANLRRRWCLDAAVL